MKKTKLIKITRKSAIFECPHCKCKIRSGKPEKFESFNYSKFATCHKCGKRIVLEGLNTGDQRPDRKETCPKCKKNKMCVGSSQCMKCYKKGNIRGVPITRRSKDVDKFTGY